MTYKIPLFFIALGYTLLKQAIVKRIGAVLSAAPHKFYLLDNFNSLRNVATQVACVPAGFGVIKTFWFS